MDQLRSRGKQLRPCPQAPGHTSVDSVRPPSKRYCNTSWASRCTSTSGPKAASGSPRSRPRLVTLTTRPLSAVSDQKEAPTAAVSPSRSIQRPAFSSANYRQSLPCGEEGLAGPVLLRLSLPYGVHRKSCIYPIVFYLHYSSRVVFYPHRLPRITVYLPPIRC